MQASFFSHFICLW